MHSALKSWTCALVAVVSVSASSASVSAWRCGAMLPDPVNVSPEHGRMFAASPCREAEIRVSGPASVARDDNGSATSPAAAMDPKFRWFPLRMFDAFEEIHFVTFDPRTGDYALYAQAGPRNVQDGTPPCERGASARCSIG